MKQNANLNKSLADAGTLATLDAVLEGVETGNMPSFNPADPVGRKVAALKKSLDKDRKQQEKNARKLKDENEKLQDRMARLENSRQVCK